MLHSALLGAVLESSLTGWFSRKRSRAEMRERERAVYINALGCRRAAAEKLGEHTQKMKYVKSTEAMSSVLNIKLSMSAERQYL